MDTDGDADGSVLVQKECDTSSDNQRFECDMEVRTVKRRRTDYCWITGKRFVLHGLFGYNLGFILDVHLFSWFPFSRECRKYIKVIECLR